MNPNRFLEKKGLRIFLQVRSVADLNAARGFLDVFGIKRRNVVIRYGSEVTRAAAREVFGGGAFSAARAPLSEKWLRVKFDTRDRTHLAVDGSLILSYVPYKYFVRVKKPSDRERDYLRMAMRIRKERKIVVVSCPSREEVLAVVRAWKRVRFSENPLLILGIRKRDPFLAGFLAGKGYRVYDRRSLRQSVKRFGGSDISILNTVGELLYFMRAADLAIVGYDRNILEPALLGVPILYFRIPLRLSRKGKELARIFRLFWRKNYEAKKVLDRFGAAVPVRPAVLDRQMDRILRNPVSMIRAEEKAVQMFYRRITDAVQSRDTSVLASAIAGIPG